jgi:Family of unknown function (DUF6491)
MVTQSRQHSAFACKTMMALSMMSLTACATDQLSAENKTAPMGNDCVFFSGVNDWRTLDNSTLVIWAPGGKEAYEVTVTMPLPGLKFAQSLAFIDGTQDGRLCSYGRDAIALNEGSAQQQSSIRSIRRLDAAGMAQLEEKYKVTLTRDTKRKQVPATPPRATAE